MTPASPGAGETPPEAMIAIWKSVKLERGICTLDWLMYKQSIAMAIAEQGSQGSRISEQTDEGWTSEWQRNEEECELQASYARRKWDSRQYIFTI